VLTRSDARHLSNGGGAGAQPIVHLKNVNVIDSADMLDQALMSPRGEKKSAELHPVQFQRGEIGAGMTTVLRVRARIRAQPRRA